MPAYSILVIERICTLIVKAESVQDAKQVALERIAKGEADFRFDTGPEIYSTRLMRELDELED